jgi:hypothetical protein
MVPAEHPLTTLPLWGEAIVNEGGGQEPGRPLMTSFLKVAQDKRKRFKRKSLVVDISLFSTPSPFFPFSFFPFFTPNRY